MNPKPVPDDQWPAWAKEIREMYAEEIDAGVGETVHRCLGEAGVAFKAILKGMGIDCGCDARRIEWNQLYPYNR